MSGISLVSLSSFPCCFCRFSDLFLKKLLFIVDSSRDAVYVGKILEGFTLTSKPAEAKTVRESHDRRCSNGSRVRQI